MVCESLSIPIFVATLISNFLVVDLAYQTCVMDLLEFDIWVDLIFLGIIIFNMILWIGFLVSFFFNYHAKIVT